MDELMGIGWQFMMHFLITALITRRAFFRYR